MTAYCFKCRTKREIRNPKPVALGEGKVGTRGVCSTCGRKMFRLGTSQLPEG